MEGRVAWACGDMPRARRALKRACERKEALLAFDLDLRRWLLERDVAGAEGDPTRSSEAAKQALDAFGRLTAPLGDGATAFRSAFNRPEILDELGAGPGSALHESESSRRLATELRNFAGADCPVLISGETGAGKEVAARELHRLSRRADRPFVAVNCAALPDELLLSELFGHEAGAFTDAGARRVGRFEAADGGTLFLDELAELSPRAQAALLRALDDGTFQRVGGHQTLTADVRVLAATNRDLAKAVSAGEFRHDLYYRLAGVQIVVPPLRERGDDAVTLARSFLSRRRALGPEAEQMIRSYPWPGNVRELKNAIVAADLLSDGEVLRPDALRACLSAAQLPLTRGVAANGDNAGQAIDHFAELSRTGMTLREYLDTVSRECIGRALAIEHGNLAAVAGRVGISRSRLSRIVSADPELAALRDRSREE
jgi:transcriptional regulator with GAF, ATPase, and Fis domain